MLMTPTWILDGEPSREITYDRLNRFMAHINKLEILNPYSIVDMYKADERWKRLHGNVCSPIVEFHGSVYSGECKKIEKMNFNYNYEKEFNF